MNFLKRIKKAIAPATKFYQMSHETLMSSPEQISELCKKPIDLNSKFDRAYVCAMHKRQIRRAVYEGREVLPQVFFDYPELIKKGAYHYNN